MYHHCKNIVERITNIGTNTRYDALLNRKIRISNTIAITGITIFFLYFALLHHLHPLFIIANWLGILLMFMMILLNHKRKHIQAFLLLCIDLSVLTLLFAYGFGKESLTQYFLLPCTILPLFFFEKKWQTASLFLFVVGCYFGCLFIFEYTEPVAKQLMLSNVSQYLQITNMMTIFSLVFIFVNLFKQEQNKYTHILEAKNEELVQKNEEISMQKEEIQAQAEELTTKSNELLFSLEQIQHKNKEITASINYARRIQQAILPLETNISVYFSDLFILFKPRDIVSGDFYWFTQKNERQIIALADCTGHGVPGAFMSMVGSSLLDKIIKDKNIMDTGQILSQLHLSVRAALKQANSDSRDGMDITLCSVDIQNQKLYFSGAKNPIYYVQNHEIKICKGDKFSIGGHQKEIKRIFTMNEISIQKNDIFYLFSDGYQDQFGGKERRKFMTKRFRNLLLENHTKPFFQQKTYLENTLENWIKTGHEKQTDDILVIGFRI